MPKKPTEKVIEACKKKINPRDVITALFSEVPELREPAIAAGVIKEVDGYVDESED